MRTLIPLLLLALLALVPFGLPLGVLFVLLGLGAALLVLMFVRNMVLWKRERDRRKENPLWYLEGGRHGSETDNLDQLDAGQDASGVPLISPEPNRASANRDDSTPQPDSPEQNAAGASVSRHSRTMPKQGSTPEGHVRVLCEHCGRDVIVAVRAVPRAESMSGLREYDSRPPSRPEAAQSD